MKINKQIKEIEKGCVKWYNEFNGEVTTKECFHTAIILTLKQFQKEIKEVQEELKDRSNSFCRMLTDKEFKVFVEMTNKIFKKRFGEIK